MGLLGNSIDWLIFLIGNVTIWGLIAFILIQVLIQFEIIPRSNQPARQLWSQLARIYDPLLRPLRRVLPFLGGFDLSPMVLIFGVIILRSLLIEIF